MSKIRISGVRYIAIFCVISIFLMICNGCSTGKEVKTKVRVGYFPNITHMQAVVGLSDNYFQDCLGQSVEIEKRIFNAGPAEVEAFMANQLDIGYIGPVPAINCFSKTDGKIKIVAGACNNGSLLLTRSDSGIKTLEDLGGKKIAVPQFGNTQDILLRRILQRSNLKTADKGGTVSVIQSENANIITLMEREHIDAALVPEPWGTALKKKLNANVLLDSTQIFEGNEYSTTVIIVRKEFLESNPEIVEKWIEAHEQITQKVLQNKEQYLQKFSNEILILTGQTMDENLLKVAFNNISLTYDIPRLSIQNYTDYLSETKLIKKNNILDDLIDPRFIEKQSK